MASVSKSVSPRGAAGKKMEELSSRAEGEEELKETNVSAGERGCGRWGEGSSLEVSQSAWGASIISRVAEHTRLRGPARRSRMRLPAAVISSSITWKRYHGPHASVYCLRSLARRGGAAAEDQILHEPDRRLPITRYTSVFFFFFLVKWHQETYCTRES